MASSILLLIALSFLIAKVEDTRLSSCLLVVCQLLLLLTRQKDSRVLYIAVERQTSRSCSVFDFLEQRQDSKPFVVCCLSALVGTKFYMFVAPSAPGGFALT